MSAPHPDPETLAGYIDGVLTTAERREMESHLAGCAECRASLADAVASLAHEELLAPAADDVQSRAQRSNRSLLRIGIGLAAAAAIVVAVWGTRANRDMATPPERRGLVAAFAGEATRPVEPRLTGGFSYAPAPVITRSAPDTIGSDRSPDVQVALADVERAAAGNRTQEHRAALGVAQLIAGQADAAIRELETLTREEPPNPRFLTDLSAAYLVDGLRTANAARLQNAVDAANRALQVEALPEALFNKALALERLGDLPAARAAWSAVREREPGSGWAAEADEHLRRLGAP